MNQIALDQIKQTAFDDELEKIAVSYYDWDNFHKRKDGTVIHTSIRPSGRPGFTKLHPLEVPLGSKKSPTGEFYQRIRKHKLGSKGYNEAKLRSQQVQLYPGDKIGDAYFKNQKRKKRLRTAVVAGSAGLGGAAITATAMKLLPRILKRK